MLLLLLQTASILLEINNSSTFLTKSLLDLKKKKNLNNLILE